MVLLKMKMSVACFFFIIGMFLNSNMVEAATIKVAVEHFPPWSFTKPTVGGINIEIINKLCKKLNLKIEYIKCPWNRCLHLMENGEADMLSGVLKRPEREKYLHFITPPYKTKSTKAFYLKKKGGVILKKFEDL